MAAQLQKLTRNVKLFKALHLSLSYITLQIQVHLNLHLHLHLSLHLNIHLHLHLHLRLQLHLHLHLGLHLDHHLGVDVGAAHHPAELLETDLSVVILDKRSATRYISIQDLGKKNSHALNRGQVLLYDTNSF